MTNPQRDAQIEQWLRQSSTGTGGESPECLDFETLAALVDNGLTTREREDAVAHASSCARCQSALAALGRTLDVPATVLPERPESAAAAWWRWLVPGVAAATAVLALAVWVRTPAPSTSTASESLRVASEPAASPAPPAAGSELNTTRAESVAPSATAPVPGVAGAPPAPEARVPSIPPATAPATAVATERGAQNFAVRSAPDTGAQPGVADNTLASPPLPPERAPSLTQPAPAIAAPPPSAGAAADSARLSTAQAPSPAAPAASTQDSLSRRAAAPAQAKVQAETQTAGALAERVAVAPGWTLISPPSGSARWRFAGDRVEASADSGATWQPATGVPRVVIRAGAAPSARVCWLVGQAGSVFRTIDGEHWERVVFPESVDLAGVNATDAESTRVTTADGRTFATADGGRTWTRR